LRGFLALLLFLTGCVSIQDSYAPPIQRKSLDIGDHDGLRSFIHVNDPVAPLHFVRDVGPDVHDGSWRWTVQYPTLRFVVKKQPGLKLVVDYTVPELTLRDTGPVTFRFFVNAHPIAEVLHQTGGGQRLEKPVPVEWLRDDRNAILAMEIDKLWVSKADGLKFGFILTSAGFIE
jgi:hypothetical protein